jgi:ribosomal protein S18 acetylase RimI-like enzyme
LGLASLPDVVRLDKSGLPQLELVLARAFEHDPLSVWLLPDASTRLGKLRWITRVGCRYAYRYGEVYATAGRIEGGSLWLTPGNETLAFTRLARCGLVPALLKTDVRRLNRLVAAAFHFKGRRTQISRPCWYLLAIGVDPTAQGRGIGSALLQQGLQKADAAGLACYLNTAKESNVGFYEHHGFLVLTKRD